jgi:hypothetical protein
MMRNQKFDPTWTGKENRPTPEPRIPVQDFEKSHATPHRIKELNLFHNKVIRSDGRSIPRRDELGQKKRATLSDHPIAIARSWPVYPPLLAKNQAPFQFI